MAATRLKDLRLHRYLLGGSMGDRDSAVVANWRERRYQLFLDYCRVKPEDTILNVGSGDGSSLERYNKRNPIVAIDLIPQRTEWFGDNATLERADATAMPYEDRQFPVAFSNSVIEHIAPQRHGAFAAEIERVSERYFVQTPNYWFPVESHCHLPLVHFLPAPLLRRWNRRRRLGVVAPGEWESVHLLSARKLRKLFPTCEIYRERVFGFTKSLMAVRR